MKRTVYLLITTLILASCGGGSKTNKNADELNKLKKERATLDDKISKLEAKTGKNDSMKATPVSIMEVQPGDFTAYVEVQSQITGDQNVNATPQMPGTLNRILVQIGQHVRKGQLMATLDASVADQQIKAIEPTLTLQKSLYDKYSNLYKQNVGTQIQLMTYKAQYEATIKQKAALVAQRDMYTIKSPIDGRVDALNIKVGDVVAPGVNGIKVVNTDKLKADANLGENYIGKVHTGDRVNLVLSDINDSIQTKLTYVAQAVDPTSRTFLAEVVLGNNSKLHPNMSCIMKIANYENPHVITVPVSVIQKTSKGDMVYIADGNKAKSVLVQTGRNSNGQVEIVSGLTAGDKVITVGYQELDNGQPITILQ